MRRRSVCTNPSACSQVLVVEAVALDDERIAVPTADGVALPDRQRIRLERSAVREDLPIGRVRVEDRDHASGSARSFACCRRRHPHPRCSSAPAAGTACEGRLCSSYSRARPSQCAPTPGPCVSSRRSPRAPAPRHKPVSSGRPSAVRGAGAERSGLPSAVRGIPGVASVSHCADTGAADTADTNRTNVASRRFMLPAEGWC